MFATHVWTYSLLKQLVTQQQLDWPNPMYTSQEHRDRRIVTANASNINCLDYPSYLSTPCLYYYIHSEQMNTKQNKTSIKPEEMTRCQNNVTNSDVSHKLVSKKLHIKHSEVRRNRNPESHGHQSTTT